MEIRDWITLVSAGIAGLWLWFSKSYLPAQQRRQDDLIQASISEQVDNREFKQQSEISSLNVLIGNNELMIKALLRYMDEDLRGIKAQLQVQSGELQRLVGNSTIQTREWTKIEEVLGDIDLMYNRITGFLEGIIIGGGQDEEGI